MNAVELDYTLTHWPTVLRAAAVVNDPWLFDFARSIAHQAKRPAWRPSVRQEQLMRRMVRELFQHDVGNPLEDED